MRELTSHCASGLNDAIKITVLDDPGPGVACHDYFVEMDGRDVSREIRIRFQNGPIGEVGFNGITNEALLAIVEDRLKCFQAGEYSCRENAIALTHVQDALHWLHHRTRERMQRGVEGTRQK